MANATVVMKLQGPIGPIEGDCQVDGYEKLIELEGWSWNLGAKDNRLTPTGISFTKSSDRATVPMLKLLQACEDAPSAEILVEEDSADSKFEVRLKLTNVRFINFSVNSKIDDVSGALDETWTVRADKAKLLYTGHLGKTKEFEIPFDPRAVVKAPEDANEDKIVDLVLQVREERFKSLMARLEKSYAQRKEQRAPAGDKKEDRKGPI